MTPTYHPYPGDNRPFLYAALQRREHLSLIRYRAEHAQDLAPLRAFLARIEAHATVIGARTRGDTLFILAASMPSDALRDEKHAYVRTISWEQAPQILETLERPPLPPYCPPVPTSCSSSRLIPDVPHNTRSHAQESSYTSRHALLTLLSEWRALMVEMDYSVRAHRVQRSSAPLHERHGTLPSDVLLFQTQGEVCALCAFQLQHVRAVGGQRHLIIHEAAGGGNIACERIFSLKEIDFATAKFTERIRRGLYQVAVHTAHADFTVNLIVPSLREQGGAYSLAESSAFHRRVSA
ncbi:hypothetical protein FFV11_03950 [Treponema pallidum subsp. pallidum]|uniref:hypothetical protein n=1 Tax=Treponema pallidum TaxID=160 RepID=UPI0011079824|nr:hypothetical protein [Treponema pallidum]QCU83428.1 hypothetical protein FFV11_03950 [Treponema pallidum subsp. pallidum]